MEHAAPEAFWVDKTKCSYANSNGQIENPTLKPCAEGISAVKAIAIAQAEGQKIYTINKANAQTALTKLPIGGEVDSEIRNAVNAGKEVTVHEKSINKHGWKGFGYIVIDPETGAGAYIIEGSGNGGWYSLVAIAAASLFLLLGVISSLVTGGLIAAIALLPYYTLAIGALGFIAAMLAQANGGLDYDCGGASTCNSSEIIVMIVAAAATIALIASGSIIGVVIGILLFVSFMKGKYIPTI